MRVIAIALYLLLSLAQAGTAQIEFGGGGFGDPEDETRPVARPDFDELVELAKRYGVTFPPKDAPLVLVNMVEPLAGPFSWLTSTCPRLMEPGFVVGRDESSGKPLVLTRHRPEWPEQDPHPRYHPSTQPFEMNAGQNPPVFLDVPGAFLTAVRLAERGDKTTARRIWLRAARGESAFKAAYRDDIATFADRPSHLLAMAIADGAYHAIRDEAVDLQSLHQRMQRLEDEFPEIFESPEPDNRGFTPFHARVRFVELPLQLRATLDRAGNIDPGSTEAILVGWGQQPMDFGGFPTALDLSLREPAPAPLVALVDRVGQTVVDLPRLSHANELTRMRQHYVPGIISSREEEPITVGDLAAWVKELLGVQDVDDFRDADGRLDELAMMRSSVLLERSVTVGSRSSSWQELAPGALLYLARHAPEALQEVSDRHREELSVSGWGFITWAIWQSTLPATQKQALIEREIVSRSTSHWPTMLFHLRQFDEARADEYVMRMLAERLIATHFYQPSALEGQPWWRLAAVVRDSRDPFVWQAYVSLAMTVHPRLRTGLVAELFRGDDLPPAVRRLAWNALQPLRDDATQWVPTEQEQRSNAFFDNPPLQPEAVRDRLAICWSYELGLDLSLDDAWPEAEKAAFRAMVFSAVENHLAAQEAEDG